MLRGFLSLETLVLVVLVSAITVGGLMFVGAVDGEDIGLDRVTTGISDLRGGDIESADIQDGVLIVDVASDHDSEYLVFNHRDADDYIVYEAELERFGGQYELDLHRLVACDEEDFPDGRFELRLISLSASDENPLAISYEVDERQSVEVPPDIVYGQCDAGDGKENGEVDDDDDSTIEM